MKRLLLLAALALPLTAAPAFAQGGLALKPYLGYNLEDGFGFLVGIGAEFDAPFGAGGLVLSIQPGVEYVFLEDIPGVDRSFLQLDGNVVASFAAPGASIAPYAGAGLAVAFVSSELEANIPGVDTDASSTELGLNILGGVELPGALGFADPFVDARLTLIDGGNYFAIRAGLEIPLGR